MRNIILGLGLALSVTVSVSSIASAAEFFVPQGHTYAPNDERLPLFNTQRDRVNARAAEIETQIFRSQLERRRRFERFRAFEDHQFGNQFQRSNTWD